MIKIKKPRSQTRKADVYNNLGLELHAKGQLDEAIKNYHKAVAINPNSYIYYYNLANALKDKLQYEEAIACYRKTLQFNPGLAYAYNNLGTIFHQKKRYDEAIAHFQKALQLAPDLANACYNVGLSLQKAGRPDEAIIYYQKSLQLNPNYADAYGNLGSAFQEKGRLDEAIACYHKALRLKPLRIDGSYAETYNNLGIALQEKGQLDEAVNCYQKALRINPDYLKAYNNLGIALQEKGRLGEAVNCYQKALRIDPNCADAYCNLGNAFKDQGKISEAEEYYRRAIQLEPRHAVAHSNFLFTINYDSGYDAPAVFREHLESARQLAEPLSCAANLYTVERKQSRRLRVGYVSPDLKRHSVAFFAEPALAAHNRESYEIFCYSDVLFPDNVTKRIQAYADQWRNIAGLSDEKVSQLIIDDRIDILIDLAGHTAKNRLLVFARKPAPVQASWIGYPATTGLAAMDYKIVDDYTDPPGMTEQFYTEKLLRLPESFLCYLPHKDSPAIDNLPALASGHITFGSFNHFAKMSAGVFAVWSEILREVPDSHLIIKAKSLSDETARRRAMDMFAREGIAARRVELLSLIPSVHEHMAVYNRIDIGLDTFPYNGTTTTCEAMWMGVPVITLEGNNHASRVGVSLLSNVGLADLIAGTHNEYVETAVNLAADIKRLKELHEGLRSRMEHSPLCDSKRFTGHLEAAYRRMWQDRYQMNS